MLLLNAVYFKGKWINEFESDGTLLRTFNTDEETVEMVPTMFVKGNYTCGALPDLNATFVKLLYKVRY